MEEEKIDKDNTVEKNPERTIEERKKNIIKFLKEKQTWILVVLIIALALGIYIRILPMTNHDTGSIPSLINFLTGTAFNGKPGLWDITTNTWTLGPDLDPWLFERYAKNIIENGSLPKIDLMRNVPLGFDVSKETMLLPYMIDWTYHISKAIYPETTPEFAGVIFPVIMFALTIIVFFFFVRELFIRKEKDSVLRANIIAIISTFFMIVSPVFLSRTVAGIPEKESAAFFFMFLTFYLFLKAWKSEKLNKGIILGILAGISTALMALIWGGVSYAYIPIALSSFISFILNKFDRNKLASYSCWLIVSVAIPQLISTKYSLIGSLTSLDTGLAFLVLVANLINMLIWKTNLSKLKMLNETKIPKQIMSLIITIVIAIIVGMLLMGGFSFLTDKIKVIHQTIFHPVTGRWSTTVAENRQPDFKEWSSSFGPFIKNIPILFWLFFIGSIVLFKKMLNKLNKKESWILTGLYFFFLLGIIFSRYSGSSIFNGENLISKLFYYSSALLLIGFFIFYYFKYHKQKNIGFEEIEMEYLLLFSLFVLTLFTARGAVRLIMVLAPVAPIFVSFLIVDSFEKAKKSKDETMRILHWSIVIIVILLSLAVFFGIPNVTSGFYQQIKSESYNFIPSYYNQQWQKAMQWVREETPEDAVFAHWWDYGYWLQSIGDRATVTDGGNAIVYWNYLTGRLVLTGENQADSLEFLYNHNTTYLLVDSSDIGKYGAFASIGSNENYDRYSWIGTYFLDEKQTQETNNQTLLVYIGGVALDEDLTIMEDGKEIFLPEQRAGIGAIIIPQEKIGNNTRFSQPYSIMIYQGKQQKVNMRYLYVGGSFIDFKSGIEACAYVFPQLIQEGQGIRQNPIGAAMFLSPRLMRGFFTQVYLLNDPFKKFPNFKIAHSEPSLIVDSLNSQGMKLPEFVYFQGIQGPIKIWKVEYTGKEKIKQEYLDTDPSKYLTWQL
ncbi:MAG: STT3 domain-containing protein [Candidatus Nanoarchaeia archaeon]|nr:STT3 domain-containing protein [Candidatus Nanoarchaeia archaeon]